MKKGLGRGLGSLFGDFEEESSENKKEVEVKVEQVVVNEPKEIEIDTELTEKMNYFRENFEKWLASPMLTAEEKAELSSLSE